MLLVRYVVEGMDEHTVLGIDHEGEVANCSATAYEHDAEVEASLRRAHARLSATGGVMGTSASAH